MKSNPPHYAANVNAGRDGKVSQRVTAATYGKPLNQQRNYRLVAEAATALERKRNNRSISRMSLPSER